MQVAIDVSKWPAKYLIKVLGDLSWILDHLTEDMKLAKEWGNEQELSEMIDLGIGLGWNLDDILSQSAGMPAHSPRLSGAKEPESFEQCIAIMKTKVRTFKSKIDQHLEALKSASKEQALQEKFLMRQLQESLALSLRNIRGKCRRTWPGKWHEGLDEDFDVYIRLNPPEC